MIDEGALQLRRQILDWRDKHYINIYRYLSAELTFLFESIEEVLDEFTISKTFKSEHFFKTRIEPIYDQWVQQESDKLLNDAEQELNQIIQHVIESDNDLTVLRYQIDDTDRGFTAKFVFSHVAGVIAYFLLNPVSFGLFYSMEARNRLRKRAHIIIRERIIYNKEKDAVCQLLQNRIFEVSNTLIKELVK